MRKNSSIWLFADIVDFDEDVKRLELLLEDNGFKGKLKSTDVVSDLYDLPQDAICFVDYGAVCLGGWGSLGESITHELLHIFEDKKSVKFIFILTMGKDVYGEDDLFEFDNVDTVDRMELYNYIKNLLKESL
jgi:hypothetical protein